MTDKEKNTFPSYVTCGGHLKCYEYKQAFKNSYLNTTQEDRDTVKSLPNFNSESSFEELRKQLFEK